MVAVMVVVAAAACGLRGQMMRVTQGVRLYTRVLYSISLVFSIQNIIMHLDQVPNRLKEKQASDFNSIHLLRKN